MPVFQRLHSLTTQAKAEPGAWRPWPLTQVSSWDEFVAYARAQGAHVPAVDPSCADRDGKLLGQVPANVLWKAANFGELFWSWTDASVRHGVRAAREASVYGADLEGKEFLPRLWAPLGIDAGPEEVRMGTLWFLSP